VSRFEQAIRILLDQLVPDDGPPSRALALGLEMESWEPSVLVIGQVWLDRAQLVRRGAEIVDVEGLAAGLEAMSLRLFDVVVVDPHVDGHQAGLRFVRAFKRSPQLVDEIVVGVTDRFADVPFIVAANDYAPRVLTVDGRWFVPPRHLGLDELILRANQVLLRPRVLH
jgi:hypothetical protein